MFFWTIKESLKNVSWFPQKLITIKKQISILEWYMKDHVTEDWSNDAEKMQFLHFWIF